MKSNDTIASLFAIDGEEKDICDLCMEKMECGSKRGKKLSCGHSICQKCVSSLRFHQQYYMLDSYECPSCQSAAETMIGTSEVTVIRVEDPDPKAISRDVKKLAEKSITSTRKSRCGDCERHIAPKRIARMARFCQQCDFNGLRPTCLECCVERHNGHVLASAQQLEANQLSLLAELRDIRRRIVETASEFDLRSARIPRENPHASSLIAHKNVLLRDVLDSNEKALKFVETTHLAAPSALRNIRRQQLLGLAQLTKASTLLEKIIASQTEESIQTEGGDRQSRLGCSSDDQQTRKVVYNVVTMLGDARLETILDQMNSRDTISQRASAYLRIASALSDYVQKKDSQGDLLLLADGLLHCFHRLHVLSRGQASEISRRLVWKQVQRAYTQLLAMAAKAFPAWHPERVDCLDDLAYLCQLYSDVCDQATVALLMIEAARARAATQQLLPSDADKAQQRLQLVDDHLMELRRIQRLHALRSSRRRGPFWKRLFRK